jgi:excisionase family DNA binding protein
MNASPVMTIKEVATYLRVHPCTLYRLLKRQGLPYFKVGSDYRFNREQIDAWRLRQPQWRVVNENPKM